MTHSRMSEAERVDSLPESSGGRFACRASAFPLPLDMGDRDGPRTIASTCLLYHVADFLAAFAELVSLNRPTQSSSIHGDSHFDIDDGPGNYHWPVEAAVDTRIAWVGSCDVEVDTLHPDPGHPCGIDPRNSHLHSDNHLKAHRMRSGHSRRCNMASGAAAGCVKLR